MADHSGSTNPIELCDLPDSLLLVVFSFLTPLSLGRLACTCSRLRDLIGDEILWRELFCRRYKVSRSVPLLPSAASWRAEYERLYDQTPMILCEELEKQADEVWHVSFSHNGQMFATCSKDGKIKVWNSSHPCRLLFSTDISTVPIHHEARFCEFNQTDTCLLVFGKFDDGTTVSGEIYVFDLHDFTQRYHVLSNPTSLEGTWLDNDHILYGSQEDTDFDISVTTLWLHKITTALQSAFESADTRLCSFQTSRNVKFYFSNIKAAACFVANNDSTLLSSLEAKDNVPECHCEAPTNEEHIETPVERHVPNCLEYASQVHRNGANKEPRRVRRLQTLTQRHCDQSEAEEELCALTRSCVVCSVKSDYEKTNGESVATGGKCVSRRAGLKSDTARVLGTSWTGSDFRETTGIVPKAEKFTPKQSVEIKDKLVILSMAETLGPRNKIVFKRIRVKTKLGGYRPQETMAMSDDDAVSLLLNREDSQQEGLNLRPPEDVDHVTDIKGHIVGIALSPDEKFLYVNARKWLQNKSDSAEDQGRVLLSEGTDIYVIDLTTFQEVGILSRPHPRALIDPQDICISISASQLYVASGALDNNGYLWDRHYGVCLTSFPHDDVVNSVAIATSNQEMLVTVGDDFRIKVWRSRRQMRQLQTGRV